MPNYSVNVSIVTRDRPLFLKNSLKSIRQQSSLPFKVVIVDNGKLKENQSILDKYSQYFRIDYYQEKKVGEAFARNKALEKFREDILVFIDDDCFADKHWIRNILASFKNYPNVNGVLGKTENLLKNNICANVYQCYYLRWLMENFKDINKLQVLKKSNFFDTKNVALKKNIIKEFSFDPNILFCSINVDIVAGNVLLKKGKFLYDPKVIVYHTNPSTFKELMVKNFIQGMADQLILEKKKIDIRKKPLDYSYVNWIKICNREANKLSFFKKIIFWFFLFLYPISYKVGRLFYKLKKTVLG